MSEIHVVCPRCLSRNPATRNYIYNVTIGQSLLCDHPWHDQREQHKSHDENEELRLLREQVRELIQLHLDERQEIALLRQIRDRLPTPSKLSSIKIRFGGNMLGPVTLTVGQKTKATVVGFDQFGAPFTGPIPTPTFALDNTTLDSGTDDGAGGFDVTSLAAGVANLTASLTTAEGTALSDTETITNVAIVPVLSSIKVDFSTPA